MMNTLRKLLGIDLRSLALLRMALASVALADLFLRARDLGAFYTDRGVFPRQAALEYSRFKTVVSLHMMGGDTAVQIALFLIAGIVLLALLFGYRTRLAAFLSLVLIVSINVRNPLVLQGGDILLRVLFFWSLFLPLGARYSLDAALNTHPRPLNQYLSGGTAAILLQVVGLYLITGILKSSPEWHEAGTAIYYVLQTDALATPVAVWLRQFDELLPVVTRLTWYFEVTAPILLFLSPLFFTPLRVLLILAFTLLQLSFVLTLKIDLFPLISIAALVPFIPAGVWDWLQAKCRPQKQAAIQIFFDGECSFCLKMVLILKEFLRLPDIPHLPAQEEAVVRENMEAHNSWVVRNRNEEFHYGWDAFVTLVGQSPVFAPAERVLRLSPVRWSGQRIYALVAVQRGALGVFTAKFLPFRSLSYRPNHLATILCVSFMIYVLAWNVATIPQLEFSMPRQSRWVGEFFQIEQYWGMFAPYPSKSNGWYVIPGVLRDSTEVDVYNQVMASPSWEKPQDSSDFFRNYRWRKFLQNLSRKKYRNYRLYYGKYLCREWNGNHEGSERLSRFKIYWVRGKTLLDPSEETAKNILLWSHDCYKKSSGKSR